METIGFDWRVSVLSVQEARERANESKDMLYSGLNPLVERRRQSTAVTFAELIKKEYVLYAKSKKKSWKDDVGKLEKNMLPEFGSLPLSSITTRDVQKCLTKINSRTSASTCNRHFCYRGNC